MLYHTEPQIDTVAVIAESLVNDESGVVEEAIDKIGFVNAVWTVVKLINWFYIITVIVIYYIVSVRMPFIPTNAFWKRNLAIAILTLLVGYAAWKWFNVAWLDILVSAIAVNFAYEFFFKFVFKGLERIGWLPLPEWYVNELRIEKEKDIKHAEAAQVKPLPADDTRI
jgi:hypothetical protein